ncbi:MAG: PcfJ domain-containing protein [Lachnospiraceae bacterium]|nr:PcfJ domain-containing protein [Lachnospiraceae bacterium]
MKKKELLAAIPDEMPDENTAKAIKTTDGKALVILLPEHRLTVGYGDVHGVVHFLWRTGYLTYYPEINIWARQAYRNIGAWMQRYGFGEHDREEVSRFTGTECIDVDTDIKNYEEAIDYKKWKKSQTRREERITKEAREAPPLPKDFREWCRKQIPTLKKRQRHLHGRKYIQMFQPCANGMYVERIFRIEFDVTKEETSYSLTEIIRAFSFVPIGKWEKRYYGVVRGKIGREQIWWDRKGGTQVNNCPNRMILYKKNLPELDLQECVLKTLQSMNTPMDYGTLAVTAENYPEIEQLIKNGLEQAAYDIVMRTNGKNREENLKTIEKLTTQQRRRIAGVGGGIYEAETLLDHPETTDKTLDVLTSIKDTEKKKLIITAAEGLNLNHIVTLLEKTEVMKTDEIREYRDYLNMAKARGMNISDEIVYRNKKWRTYHAKYIEEKEADEDKEINRKYQNIINDYEENCREFQAAAEGYLFLVPRSASDIRNEGRLQHHCVGRAGYIEKMDKRESFIVFLRKAAEPEVPYYTIETDGTRIVQAYGAYDRKPDWNEVNKLLQEWIREVRKRKARLELRTTVG